MGACRLIEPGAKSCVTFWLRMPLSPATGLTGREKTPSDKRLPLFSRWNHGASPN